MVHHQHLADRHSVVVVVAAVLAVGMVVFLHSADNLHILVPVADIHCILVAVVG